MGRTAMVAVVAMSCGLGLNRTDRAKPRPGATWGSLASSLITSLEEVPCQSGTMRVSRVVVPASQAASAGGAPRLVRETGRREAGTGAACCQAGLVAAPAVKVESSRPGSGDLRRPCAAARSPGALDAFGDQAGLAHYAQVVGEGRLAQLEPGLLHDLGAQGPALLEDRAVHAAREPCWSTPTRRTSWRRSPAACWPVLARADSLGVIGDQALSRQANGPLS